MRVLITGGAGFIGSHLADEHLRRGHEVHVLDNLVTGSKSNVAHLLERPDFTYTEGSILDEHCLLECMGSCDAVHHLAAAVGVKYILENPFVSLRTNVVGTEQVLQYAAALKKRVLIASTSEIYGKQTKAPLSEGDDRVLGPTQVFRWSYASTKALDEFLAYAYGREYGLETVIVRLFNTVGPRQTGAYGMVLPRFVQAALAGDPITVYGDGTQSRTFTYVEDAVWAMAELLERTGERTQIYNLGGITEISIKDLAERVKTITGSSSAIRFIPYEEAYDENFQDMPRRVPDLTRIRAAIGYEPRTDLDTIIEKVAAHLREHPDG